MIYVGRYLPAAPGADGAAYVPAPCLINPSLEVVPGRVSRYDDMSYWPSYSFITPEHRHLYLNWLSTRKHRLRDSVGYARLYLCGIERRLLVDDPGPAEQMQLVDEVRRLRK